jgi:hypothetical protein
MWKDEIRTKQTRGSAGVFSLCQQRSTLDWKLQSKQIERTSKGTPGINPVLHHFCVYFLFCFSF